MKVRNNNRNHFKAGTKKNRVSRKWNHKGEARDNKKYKNLRG